MLGKSMRSEVTTSSSGRRDLRSVLKEKVTLRRVAALATCALAVGLVAVAYGVAAQDDNIEVKQLDAVVRNSPLAPDATGAIVDYVRAGGAEVGVLVMRKNRLHHHSHQDHVLYLVRGQAIAKLENVAGQVETRTIKPGDILSLPRGKKHGFEKSSDEDLVFLVVATPLPPDVEETTYHE
jgi:quercetin dioxygenase-like cupin family protein